jgi:hypothetical protein
LRVAAGSATAIQPGQPLMRADERHDHLHDGHHEGEDQGEMSNFAMPKRPTRSEGKCRRLRT